MISRDPYFTFQTDKVAVPTAIYTKFPHLIDDFDKLPRPMSMEG